MLSAWVKHQTVDKIFKAFPNAKNSAVCTEFPMCSKLHFSQWKIYFSQYFDKLISALFYVNYLISNSETKLGHIPNSSKDLKLGFFECWSQVALSCFSQFTKRFLYF